MKKASLLNEAKQIKNLSIARKLKETAEMQSKPNLSFLVESNDINSISKNTNFSNKEKDPVINIMKNILK